MQSYLSKALKNADVPNGLHLFMKVVNDKEFLFYLCHHGTQENNGHEVPFARALVLNIMSILRLILT
jgi:hypothetical protein